MPDFCARIVLPFPQRSITSRTGDAPGRFPTDACCGWMTERPMNFRRKALSQLLLAHESQYGHKERYERACIGKDIAVLRVERKPPVVVETH